MNIFSPFFIKKGSPKDSRAFTLIELLVVIAIIALLAGIITTGLFGSRGKARDTKRISDVGNMQNAVELYFDRCKAYPSTFELATANSYGGTCVVNLGNFISVKPVPPPPPTNAAYTYSVSGNPPISYIISTTLEGYSEILTDDYDDASCGAGDGTGQAERIYCVTSR